MKRIIVLFITIIGCYSQSTQNLDSLLLTSSNHKLLNSIANLQDTLSFYNILNGIFDDSGNLWLSYTKTDLLKDEETEIKYAGKYMHWYIAKFDQNGKSTIKPFEVERSDARAEGYGALIYLGNINDIYGFSPDLAVRVKSNGEYHVDCNIKFTIENCYITPSGIIWLMGGKSLLHLGMADFHTTSNSFFKFQASESMPVFIEEKKEYQRWATSSMILYNSNNKALILMPVDIYKGYIQGFSDTSLIRIYRINLKTMKEEETSTFQIKDALFKKITGVHAKKLSWEWGRGSNEINTLLHLPGDTLLAFLLGYEPSGYVIYVCKLNKNGKPIKPNMVPVQEIKIPINVENNEKVIQKKLIIRSKLMIFEFCPTGNVYEYIRE